MTDKLEIEYGYSYEGDDFLRGPKFARLSESVYGRVVTNKEIVISSKRIVSYWPGAKFNEILITGGTTNKPIRYWTGLVFTEADKYARNLNESESIDSSIFELKAGKNV